MDLMINVNRTELETVEGGCVMWLALILTALATGASLNSTGGNNGRAKSRPGDVR